MSQYRSFWRYLTFIPEAEHDGRGARIRTELYLKAMDKIRKRIHETALHGKEVDKCVIWLFDSGILTLTYEPTPKVKSPLDVLREIREKLEKRGW